MKTRTQTTATTRTSKMARISWSLAVGLTLSASAFADQFDGIRGLIRQRLQEERVPAISVAVWRDGKVIWEEGFGWADMENRVPATQHTMFCLASLSKTMTATGLMTLVQAGKVDLDKPANNYLGQDTMKSWIGDPKAVTVRTLANHTSGLPGSDQWFYGKDAVNAPSMSETIQRYGILVAPAGERHEYSNIGYGILGHLLAQVSGKSYEDFMRQEVFLPLGMTHSSVNLAPGLEQHQAIRYDYDRKRIPFYLSAEPASASVYASAHDLARFGMFFLKNRLPDQQGILTDESMAQMTQHPISEEATPVRAARPDEGGYAVGWITSQEGGYQIMGHSGSTSGVNSNFSLVPSENLGVVVLANADGGTGNLRTEILKSLLPGWREPAPASKTPATSGASQAAKPSQSAEPAFKPTPQLIGTWQGQLHTYEGEQPVQLKVMPSGDVHVRIGNEPRFANRSTLQQEALVNGVKFKNGTLTGRTLAQIETSDTQRHPHTVSLELKQRGNVLNGVMMASSVFEGFWVYGLPYWTELKKVSGLKE